MRRVNKERHGRLSSTVLTAVFLLGLTVPLVGSLILTSSYERHAAGLALTAVLLKLHSTVFFNVILHLQKEINDHNTPITCRHSAEK